MSNDQAVDHSIESVMILITVREIINGLTTLVGGLYVSLYVETEEAHFGVVFL